MSGPLWWTLAFLMVLAFSWAGWAGRANVVGWAWGFLAWLCGSPTIAQWIIRRAQRTPYHHIPGYMERFWVFNSWESKRYVSWLPSMRVHHILREDLDRHPHDHPWPWRTIILRGWYWEHRLKIFDLLLFSVHFRPTGTTAGGSAGTFHRISRVSPGGVWTLFLTWGKPQPWGFYVDGKKVPSKEYPSYNR